MSKVKVSFSVSIDGFGAAPQRYTCTEHVAGERATHVVLGRHATY
jgi:hypothetical protein